MGDIIEIRFSLGGKGEEMVSGVLQTFTNSWQGLRNPKMEKIMRDFREECQPIIDKYINKFSQENIEYCSMNGAFYEEFASMLLNARLQVMLDLPQEDVATLGKGNAKNEQ